jgi:hypothetical protein
MTKLGCKQRSLFIKKKKLRTSVVFLKFNRALALAFILIKYNLKLLGVVARSKLIK